ncbi:ATP-dependent helicase [Candidatus Saccharibacteria bacterium]|nr:ATP-dependent helicase [Candidatus Saccharibacteria bacterium]
MGSYGLEYKKLNSAQQKAVDTIDGPLLVIAGPGTGKTQLLAMRVANILKSTDTDQYSILCLTFTNKAAVNMKDRIIKLTDGGGAGVNVRTFHSFAAEIMNLYPDSFWQGADLTVAPESVQLDIIESIISELPLDNPLALKFAGQYTLVNDVQSAINLVKEAGLTPDDLKKIINSNIAYIESISQDLIEIFSPRLSNKKLKPLLSLVEKLPEQKEEFKFPFLSFKKALSENLSIAIDKDLEGAGTINTRKIKNKLIQNIDGNFGPFEEIKRNNWWLNLAEVYESYREEMHKRGFYDYSDMIVEVISELSQNPDMLADLQERYLYVLIDEFQDTNPAQLALAKLVSEHYSDEGKPNIMAVGDDDQSIYKFNGAELSNMMNFKREYPQGELIVLTDNYRSSQAILETSETVINLASNRLVGRFEGLNKKLTAATDDRSKSIIIAEKYSSREEQLSAVARRVKEDKKKGLEIAVIARNHDSLIKMASLLQQVSVPVHYEQQSNILDHEMVKQVYLVISLLESLQNGDRNNVNATIHKVIRHPLWGIKPENLWSLAKNNFNSPNWLESMLGSNDETIKNLANWFLWLSKESSRQPLAVTLEYILGLRGNKKFTSPMKSYFLDEKQDVGTYFHGISAVQLLRSLVNDFSKSGEPSLSDLVRFIDINMNNHKIIADESPFVSGNDGVQLLTVHKSKGLEFDSVYIVDLIEKNWQPRGHSRKSPLNLPLQPAGDDIDDYVRLLYVAITRARRKVYLSGFCKDHSGSDVALSPLFLSSFDVKDAKENAPENLVGILEAHLHWPDLSKADEKEVLKARLKTYNLSVTDLINFLDLENAGPKYFKEHNLLRLPEAKSPSLSHGTAMHSALEYAQKLTNQNKFNLEEVVNKYEGSLKNERLSVAEYQKFLKHGRAMLKQLFEVYGYSLSPNGKTEQKLKDIIVDEARISGKLDVINSYADVVEVVDYKTGKGVPSIHSKAKNLEGKIWRYKTQLAFYQLLLESSGRLSKNKTYIGKVVFVETDNKKSLTQSYQPNKEELGQLKTLVTSVWQKIINLDLPDTSRYTEDHEGTKSFMADLINNNIN